ncbi:MAG: pyridoxal 5'-phosphate synthase glutaminase subunit PdxT [Actinomycetes bacterium]
MGVLALQGDVREHISALNDCGVDAKPVRTSAEISSIEGLIIPGGESTTIAKLARSFDLFDLISGRIREGLPTYGSCAGMILLANELVDGAEGQETFGGLDVKVRRNAFGRQVDSFETDLDFLGLGAVHAVFIRAPWVETLNSQVEVLAAVEIDGVSHPVAVRQKSILATSFHPELTGDNRVHRYFVTEICHSS